MWEEEARDEDFLGALAGATTSPGLIEGFGPRRDLVGEGSKHLGHKQTAENAKLSDVVSERDRALKKKKKGFSKVGGKTR